MHASRRARGRARKALSALGFAAAIPLASHAATPAPGPGTPEPSPSPIAAAADSSPAVAPELWVLAHVDVETTGLVAGYHELVDIGVLYTDLDGRRLGHFFARVMPEHPERLSPRAAEINGFSAERWTALGARPLAPVLADLVAYEDRMFPGRPRLRVAYNSWFDAGFLQEAFLAAGLDWRERYARWFLDLPSMAWALGWRETRNWILAPQLGLPPETDDPLEHTGLSGVEWNVALYRALLGRQRQHAFLARFADACGRAYAGRLVENSPAPAAGADPFQGQPLRIEVSCAGGGVRIALEVGEDRSRTWILDRSGSAGLRFAHDHRHADGTPDAVTGYGGIADPPGTANRQEFPVDAATRALFEREGLEVSLANRWAFEFVDAGEGGGPRLRYELTRPGRRFVLEFDLARPLETAR